MTLGEIHACVTKKRDEAMSHLHRGGRDYEHWRGRLHAYHDCLIMLNGLDNPVVEPPTECADDKEAS